MARKRKQVNLPEGGENTEDEDNSDVERANREDERGRTVLATVGKAIQNGTKIPLEWDRIKKIPCGEFKDTFSTYIGVIARERVCITYKTWNDVPKVLLDDLYESIKVSIYILN